MNLIYKSRKDWYSINNRNNLYYIYFNWCLPTGYLGKLIKRGNKSAFIGFTFFLKIINNDPSGIKINIAKE